MGDRIRALRSALKMTQNEFAEKIGLARNSIANYEINRREPTNAIIMSICREFRVDEQWLRTGEGEMFIVSDNTLIAQLVGQYGLDEFDQKILEIYVSLPEGHRAALKDFARRIADVAGEYVKTEFSEEVVPENLLSDDEIEAKGEAYKEELRMEKDGLTSLASPTIK